MKIAVVGSGISGLTVALLLNKKHDVKVFEAAEWIGGHTHTVPVEEDNTTLWIDTGFIVCNDKNYPNFIELMKLINVTLQKTTMSFSVRADEVNLEYNGTSIDALFSQRKNIFNRQFWSMLKDIVKFNTFAKKFISLEFSEITFENFIKPLKLNTFCIEYYLLPMVAAIWSKSVKEALKMPAWFVCQFLENHGMLNINHRPQWYSILGGSHVYVNKISALLKNRVQTSNPVKTIFRHEHGVKIVTATQQENFDRVVIATHSDQALRLLAIPSSEENEILSNIRYNKNEVVLHTDTSVLPKNPRAWASWNYYVENRKNHSCLVSYNMNILQNLNASKTYCVSLNQSDSIKPSKILVKLEYEHPIYDITSKNSQKRISEINGKNNTYYCGAYWGAGFHEDGVNSALNIVKKIDEELLCIAPFILEP
jgi:predicted NAD/FAD-binding protein